MCNCSHGKILYLNKRKAKIPTIIHLNKMVPLPISGCIDALCTLLITILIIIFALYLYMTRNFQYWKKRGVVEIPPVPVFGSFAKYFLNNTSAATLIRSFYDQNENQPYVGFYALDKPCLLLRDLNIIKQILVTDFPSFSDKFMKPSESDQISIKSLPFVKNPHWKNLRLKLSPAFSIGKLKNAFPYLKEVAKDLNNYLDSLGPDDLEKTIDIKEVCAKFTTDMIGLALFGLKLNSLTDPEAEFRKFGKLMFGDSSSKRSIEFMTIFMASHIANFLNLLFIEKRSGEFFKRAFANILNERKASEIIRNDLIDLLIQFKNDDNKIELDDLLSQAIILFGTGFDTTSTVMSFVILELAKNLDFQTKLRNEINNAMAKNNGEITYEMVSTLPYLEMVVLETLRLHPTVPTIDRIATTDYKVAETGLIIEKGTPIFISLFGLHYDKKHFDSPELLNPENFSEDNKGSKNPAYMPFGVGPRSCIAMRQGLFHAKYGVAQIISRFEVTQSNHASVKVNSKAYFTSVNDGVFLNLRKI